MASDSDMIPLAIALLCIAPVLALVELVVERGEG